MAGSRTHILFAADMSVSSCSATEFWSLGFASGSFRRRYRHILFFENKAPRQGDILTRGLIGHRRWRKEGLLKTEIRLPMLLPEVVLASHQEAFRGPERSCRPCRPLHAPG